MRIIWIAIALICGLACKKKNIPDCSEAICPAIYLVGPFLGLTFSDKTTNHDLFFDPSPAYQLNDLVVFKKKNMTDTVHSHVYVDSSNTIKHFMVIALGTPDTLFIQIQNQKTDTIDLTLKTVCTGCCPSGFVFERLNLNGNLVCLDCPVSTIVAIKK